MATPVSETSSELLSRDPERWVEQRVVVRERWDAWVLK